MAMADGGGEKIRARVSQNFKGGMSRGLRGDWEFAN